MWLFALLFACCAGVPMMSETTYIGLACNYPRGVTACWAVLTWLHVRGGVLLG